MKQILPRSAVDEYSNVENEFLKQRATRICSTIVMKARYRVLESGSTSDLREGIKKYPSCSFASVIGSKTRGGSGAFIGRSFDRAFT